MREMGIYLLKYIAEDNGCIWTGRVDGYIFGVASRSKH